jgi:hypothetical protein
MASRQHLNVRQLVDSFGGDTRRARLFMQRWGGHTVPKLSPPALAADAIRATRDKKIRDALDKERMTYGQVAKRFRISKARVVQIAGQSGRR